MTGASRSGREEIPCPILSESTATPTALLPGRRASGPGEGEARVGEEHVLARTGVDVPVLGPLERDPHRLRRIVAGPEGEEPVHDVVVQLRALDPEALLRGRDGRGRPA